MSEGLAFVCIWKVAENMDLRKVVFYPLVILHSQDIMEETVFTDMSICNGKSIWGTLHSSPNVIWSSLCTHGNVYENLIFGSLPFFHIC